MPTHGLPMYRRHNLGIGRCVNFLCAVVLTVVLAAGIIFFVLWLSLRPHRPKFFLAEFSILSLNRQSGLANLPVRFIVNEQNPNQKIGIYYGAIDGSVYYGDQLIASGPVMPRFYQAPKGEVAVRGELTATGPVPTDRMWQRFAGEVSAGSVTMRLRFNSTVRFKVKVWDTREHHVKVDCEAKLRPDGTLQPTSKNSQCTLYV
ncbi:hypothetical protein ACP4OV_029616 [Aristida adscensionis]